MVLESYFTHFNRPSFGRNIETRVMEKVKAIIFFLEKSLFFCKFILGEQLKKYHFFFSPGSHYAKMYWNMIFIVKSPNFKG